MKKIIIFGALIVVGLFSACTSNTEINSNALNQEVENKEDPLPSWNEAATKASVLHFVAEVTI